MFDCGQAAASYLAVKGNTSVTVPHLFLVDAQGIIRNDWAYDLLARDIFEGEGLFSEVQRVLSGDNREEEIAGKL